MALFSNAGSAHRPGGLGQIDTDFTGSGVRAAAAIIRNILYDRSS